MQGERGVGPTESRRMKRQDEDANNEQRWRCIGSGDLIETLQSSPGFGAITRSSEPSPARRLSPLGRLKMQSVTGYPAPTMVAAMVLLLVVRSVRVPMHQNTLKTLSHIRSVHSSA